MPTNMIEISHLLLIASTECVPYRFCWRKLPRALGALVLTLDPMGQRGDILKMQAFLLYIQGFHRVYKNLKKLHFLEKSWKVMELWKIIKSHGKVMELRKSHTDKSSPSTRNLALISFASHLVSCIHSNTSDYELLGEFETNHLVYCHWFLI